MRRSQAFGLIGVRVLPRKKDTEGLAFLCSQASPSGCRIAFLPSPTLKRRPTSEGPRSSSSQHLLGVAHGCARCKMMEAFCSRAYLQMLRCRWASGWGPVLFAAETSQWDAASVPSVFCHAAITMLLTIFDTLSRLSWEVRRFVLELQVPSNVLSSSLDLC